jgi:hypothetical protein
MTVIAATGGGYVAAAYVVFIALILLYVVIMSFRTARIERDVREIEETLQRRRS